MMVNGTMLGGDGGENRKDRKLKEALDLLELTQDNRELAEKYLDMDGQEEPELLKEAEPQNFYDLPGKSRQPLYNLLNDLKREDEALALRFIRFAAAAGGVTARVFLTRNGWGSDFRYLQKCLSDLQIGAIYADRIAWFTANMREKELRPLIELGKQDPEVFPQMIKLCPEKGACNTEMLLFALYLHCVKPLQESGSRFCTPVAEDTRAEGSPERIREMRDYLERRLLSNVDGLFTETDEPGEEDVEKLKAFVRDSDPGEEFPHEIRAILSGRKRNDFKKIFLPMLAFLAVEHSDRFVSLIRLAAAVEADAVPNLSLDACAATGEEWFHGHIRALEEVLWLSHEAYIRWAVLRREKEVLERMVVKAPEVISEVIRKIPTEDYGYLLAQVRTKNPKLYGEEEERFAGDYRRTVAEQDVEKIQPAKDRAMAYLLGEAEIGDILPYVEQWRELNLFSLKKCDRIHTYLESGEKQLYRRALVLECLCLQKYYFSRYWVEDGAEPTESWRRNAKHLERHQMESIARLLEEEKVPARYQIDFFGTVYDGAYEFLDGGRPTASYACVQMLAEFREDWHQEWMDASQSKYMQTRIMAIRVMGERAEEYKEGLLACASESAKQVRGYLWTIYTRHREWEADILEMLKSSKSGCREMAVNVLQSWGASKYRQAFEQALEAEKTKKLRTMMQEILASVKAVECAGGNGMSGTSESTGGNGGLGALESAGRNGMPGTAEGAGRNGMWGVSESIGGNGMSGTAGGIGGNGLPDALKSAGTRGISRAAEPTPEELIHEILMGGRKRKLVWLSPETLCKVHKLDGEEASKDYMAALLVSYADMRVLGVNREAGRLAAGLRTEELAVYVGEIYQRFMEDGAQAKKKWVLYASSIHGGEAMVSELYARIQEWAGNARGAMAAEAVKALALNGTSTALLQVDQIARKFKFRQVKSAAARALDYAAEQLGISREDLEDRIVPNLGFTDGMERIFDYGRRQFKVLLTTDLSLEVYDGNGKKLKNLPAPGKTDDPELSQEANEAWKLLKKQLKTVVTNQKTRLEQALRVSRQWEPEKWKELFVKNPVMHQFAIGLVWGVYEEGVLKETFRYMEDGTFNTVEEEEYELPKADGQGLIIGLVHPIELTGDALAAWKEQLEDYEITQPIEQLTRPVYRVTEEEKEATDLIRFGGVALNGLSLVGKLQDMGWYKGEVGDGGGYDTFYRHDRNQGVELVFSGTYIGGENETVVVYEAYFYQPGVTEKVGSCYLPVRRKLGQVDPRYFSEVVLQLTRATASSQERRPYPDCRLR